MATIKSFTSLEQSKKLAEILPIESADMYYSDVPVIEWIYKTDISKGTYVVFKSKIFYTENLHNHEIGKGDIYAWSLAALLGVLPKGTNISTPKPINALGYCCWNQYDEIYASNPIDACYDMIIRLHELNLL